MISWHDLYTILIVVIPLYVTMILAYGSVRWWKIFSSDQCSGINRFVSIFAIPFLVFHFTSTNNPYAMNLRFIAADTLQKIIMLVVLSLWTNLTKNGSIEWMITIFSLSTLPSTLVMGVPLLVAMYGEFSASLMVQVVVLQVIIWNSLLLVLFECRCAKMLIMEQFPETASSIVSFRVDSDVASLDRHEFLETDAGIGDDGMIHVTVRKSNPSRRLLGTRSLSALSSSRNSMLRDLNFNRSVHSSHVLGSTSFGLSEQSWRSDHGAEEIRMSVGENGENKAILKSENFGGEAFIFGGGGDKREEERENEGVTTKATGDHDSGAVKQMPPASVVTRLILIIVWRKLIRNPNTYSSLLGLVWSLIAFRWHVNMPNIIEKSITILSDTSLGMTMFSLGLFMALQPKIIACGYSVAAFSMAVKFFISPIVMAVSSIVVGLRGTLLCIAIVQAALPQGVVPFIYAKEYNVHPTILSTGVIFGMLIALPITLLYYIVLAL